MEPRTLEEVFVGISYPPEMSLDEAVRRAKAILADSGYASGAFALEQQVSPGEAVGNLEVDASVVEALLDWDGPGYEKTAHRVTLRIDTP